ncbi:MAG: hypothetical protein OXG55_03830 [bacterium]|nr:hypothetical protein [bacterium]MCY3952830.1 hypothetical protein [bacterium]MCY4102384.1 hypothetical protein [bacterium]
MSTQLLLFNEPAGRQPPADGRSRPAAAWVLDDETRAIGRRHVAEARAILRARRATAERGNLHRPRAQPAA